MPHDAEPAKTAEPSPRLMLSVPRAGILAWSLLGILLVLVAALWLLLTIKEIFPPLILAFMIILILNPVVSALERRGVRRGWGTLAIYLLALSVVVIVVLLLTPVVGAQLGDLTQRLPEIADNAAGTARDLAGKVGVELNADTFSQFLQGVRSELTQGVQRVLDITLNVLHVVLVVVLAPIIAGYLLIDLPRLQRSFVAHLPPARKDDWLMLLDRSGQAVGAFFRGQLLVAAIVAAVSVIALGLAGIPYWLPIGLLAGAFNLIPLVGPFVGGALAVTVGAASGGAGKALLAAGIMLGVQQLDNHFISPNVMGRSVKLHPVTIMLSVLGGATVAGLWGMLLAVPGVAVVKIVGLHYYTTRVLKRASPYEEASGETPAGLSPEGEKDGPAAGGSRKERRPEPSVPSSSPGP